jgi:choline dehydrogenase
MSDHDLIVVGGGSAGCAMAARLAEDGRHRILLLEAGETDRVYRSRVPALMSSVVQDPAFDWRYVAEPDPSIGGRADVWPAGKRLGGGSAINGMMFIRGHAWDYDHWAQLGAAGWDYASVLPYFKRMERNERGEDPWRGGRGPLWVSEGRAQYPITQAWIDAAQQAGIERSPDLNGARAEGVDFVQVSQRNGLRCSSAAAYIHGSHRANLAVDLTTQVLRVILKNGRATGVEILRDGAKRIIGAKHGVIICAGSMNSPRLLMLSGIGPAQHLKEVGVTVALNAPGVGENLQDHVGTHLVNNVNIRTLNNDAQGLRGLAQLFRFAIQRRGVLTTSIGHAHAFVRSRSTCPAPNLQLAFAAFAFDLDSEGKLILRDKPSVSTLIALMRPTHRGRITLRSGDPLAAPVISHRLLGSDEDIEQLVEGLALARSIMNQPAIARFVTDEVRPGVALTDLDQIRAYVRAASIPLYHPVGTCKMGEDKMAVVDSQLRVRGIAGLWVADASIMPTLPAGNTNATSIMIGDKGAAHVLRALTRSDADSIGANSGPSIPAARNPQ